MKVLVLGDDALAAGLAAEGWAVSSGALPQGEEAAEAAFDAWSGPFDATVIAADGPDLLVRAFCAVRRAAEEALLDGGRIVVAVSPGCSPPDRGGLFALVRCVTRELGPRGLAANLVVADGADRLRATRFLASPDASFVNGACLGPLELPAC